MIQHLGSSVYLTVGKKGNYPAVEVKKRKMVNGQLNVGTGIMFIEGQFNDFSAIATEAYSCLKSKKLQSFELSKYE